MSKKKEIDIELQETLNDIGYESYTPYKELTPALVGISLHDGKLCYDSDKLPDDLSDFPMENYHVLIRQKIDYNSGVVFFTEDCYKGTELGITDENRVVYDYDVITNALAKDFANGKGVDIDTLDDDKKHEYWESAREWIDYNTIRSLPYDIMGGKPMPIVVDTDVIERLS